jgi:hypothetical protein
MMLKQSIYLLSTLLLALLTFTANAQGTERIGAEAVSGF